MSAAELVRRTTSGQLTATETVGHAMRMIAQHDGALNAFSVVRAQDALHEAVELDAAVAAGGAPGPLHGVPIAVKDNLDVTGCVSGLGGVANTTPASTDCEAVRRLREAGAIVVGKTRMPELGLWPHTESVHGGITRNPWDPMRSAGGSSGGSAVAVAAGMVPVAIGTDGGGSIRVPAACCGIYGLKPSRGRVTAGSQPALWSGLVTSGPMARTVLDAALVGDVIRGQGTRTGIALQDPSMAFADAARRDPGRLRIGWSGRPVRFSPRVHADHNRAVAKTARLLAGLGHHVCEIDVKLPASAPVFLPQMLAGVRDVACSVEHLERLDKHSRFVCRAGGWVSDGALNRALAARNRMAANVNRLFEDIDVLLTPTTPARPRAAGCVARRATLQQMIKAAPIAAFTSLWNVTGHPAAAVPAGLGADGLPLSVQLITAIGDETTLLSVSAQLERVEAWTWPDDACWRQEDDRFAAGIDDSGAGVAR